MPRERPLVVAVDDTLVRRSGTKSRAWAGSADPLGPAFQTNLVRGQRYVQFSAAWPLAAGAARLVPIGFHHAPGAPKLPKALAADGAAQALHRAERQRLSLTVQTLAHHKTLRAATPAGRKIVLTGDGGFHQRAHPQRTAGGTTYLGRMRKDAVLHHPPPSKKPGSKGRKLRYGARRRPPKHCSGDQKIPWRQVEAFAAGKRHRFKIKTMAPVLWRKAGADKKLRIIVITPLGYRLRKASKLLYRQPALYTLHGPGTATRRSAPILSLALGH